MMRSVKGQKKYVGSMDGFNTSEFAEELNEPVDFRRVCCASAPARVVIKPGGKSDSSYSSQSDSSVLSYDSQ